MNVYLSYTRDLEKLADRLAQELRVRDLNPLMDKVRIAPGDDWSVATKDVLRSADAFVFLIGTNPTSWVEREWSRAVQESWRKPGAPMVPVVLEGCTPPAFLHERQALPLRRDAGDKDRKQLIGSIADALQKTAKAPAPSVAKEQRAKQRERLDVLKKQANKLQPNRAELKRQAENLKSLLARQEREDSPKLADTATQLADVMKSLNEPDQILHYQQLALESLVKHTGESHPDAARTHANLAASLESLKRRPEALEHLKKALAIYRETTGPDTMAVAMTEMRLADMLRKTGQAKAAKVHERASQETLKAASLSFFTGLPIIGSIIKRAVKQTAKRDKKTRKKKATRAKTPTAKKKKVTRKRTAIKKKRKVVSKKTAVKGKKTGKKKKATEKTKNIKKQITRKKTASRKKQAAKSQGRRQ